MLLEAMRAILGGHSMFLGVITDPRDARAALGSVRGYADAVATAIRTRDGQRLAVRLANDVGSAIKTLANMQRAIDELPDRDKWYDKGP
jgi:hypothetical protein